MGKPKLLRIPEGSEPCSIRGESHYCDHIGRYRALGYVYCACHIPISNVRVGKKMLTEAINYAAIEHPIFQINPEGEIRLEED